MPLQSEVCEGSTKSGRWTLEAYLETNFHIIRVEMFFVTLFPLELKGCRMLHSSANDFFLQSLTGICLPHTSTNRDHWFPVCCKRLPRSNKMHLTNTAVSHPVLKYELRFVSLPREETTRARTSLLPTSQCLTQGFIRCKPVVSRLECTPESARKFIRNTDSWQWASLSPESESLHF